MRFLLVALALLPSLAFADLQLFFAPPGSDEQPVGGTFELGAAYVGDASSARFRIRNTGNAAVTVTSLRVSGTGFTMTGQPSLPHIVAPGFNLDFTVTFRPPDYGYFSANLQINSMGVLLRASGNPSASFFVDGQQVSTGSTIDLGHAERGDSRSLDVEIRNTTREPVAVAGIVISGGAFSLPAGNPAPVSIQPGRSVVFTVRFTPDAAQIFTGSLTIDGNRVIRLTGTGVEPPMPRPSVILLTPVIRSGEQGRVTVRFASASRAKGKGQLKMELRPARGARDNDAAAQLTTGGRTVSFDVVEGSDLAWFSAGARNEVVFQAGTTAGTIVFIAEAGGYSEQATVTVDSEAVHIEKASASRNGSTLEVQILGFDNTRTVGTLSFTFYNASGQTVAGTPVKVDSGADFLRWWDSSILGGIFSLRAAFPVTGDVSQIKGVEVEIVNSTGTSRTDRLSF